MQIKKIIISRTDKIGDLVLSIPSFYMLSKMYPKAQLIVLVRNYNYEVVKNLPYIHDVIKIDEFNNDELRMKIASLHADVFIALYSNSIIASLARISKARIRIGPLSKLTSYFSYNYGVRQKRSKSIKNEAMYNLDLVKKLNPNLFQEAFVLNHKIFYEEKHKTEALSFINTNNITKPFIIINPFAGGSGKNLTTTQYKSLIENLLDAISKVTIVLITHVSEENRAVNMLDNLDPDRVKLFINKGSLLNIAALIDEAEVYIGSSTGPTHIAGSLNKNIVAIYGNRRTQAPTRWGALGSDNVFYIIPDKNYPAENYHIEEFESYTKEMENEIVEKVKEFLN